MTALITSRRTFLRSAATTTAGAFVLGASISIGRAQPQLPKPLSPSPHDPNVFLTIARPPDNTITLICKHLEMGQGVATGLATLVAEELGADWSQMRFEFAQSTRSIQAIPSIPSVSLVAAATSTSSILSRLPVDRRPCARPGSKCARSAPRRALFIAAAADAWNVKNAEKIDIDKGFIVHGTKRVPLGTFADKAMHPSLLESLRLKRLLGKLSELEPKLKEREDWQLIGKNLLMIGTTPLRLDSEMKTNGKAQFALDVKRPGMLTVVVCRPDKFGATFGSFDASDTLAKFPDVKVRLLKDRDGQTVVGVGVYATNTWAAIEGRKALKVDWKYDHAETRSSEEIFDDYRKLFANPGNGQQIEPVGNAADALARTDKDKIVEKVFKFPFLAHAPMEPLNCTIELTDKGADIWSGCQLQTVDQLAAARELGFTLEPWKVKINTMLAGGSFGRRGAPAADLVVEACRAARAIGLPVPVHLVWTREDDIQGGYYRPMVMHHVKAGWTADGGISGWQHQLASKSIFTEATSLGALENKLIFDAYKNFDDSTVEGVEGTQYAIDNFEVRQHNVTTPAVPVTWWRSVGNSHTAFVMETMVDELAHRAEKDPVEFRLGLLKDPRDQAVLNLVREKSKWDTWQKAERRGHGIAFHYSFRTRVAMVAEVTLGEADNTVTVDRIVAAVDVGTAINPDIVRAQVEGAVGFALSMVLRNQITLRDGKVEQSNFDDYEPTRMREMPKVKVCIVDSKEDPSGIGEPGVPPVAPAIGNAIADAMKELTGKRTYCYELPLGYATPLPKA